MEVNDLSHIQGFIVVQANKRITLRSVVRGNAALLDLDPGLHDFFILDFDDGRPKKEWAVLNRNQGFGIPIDDLKRLDGNDDVVVRSKNSGRYYFDD